MRWCYPMLWKSVFLKQCNQWKLEPTGLVSCGLPSFFKAIFWELGIIVEYVRLNIHIRYDLIMYIYYVLCIYFFFKIVWNTHKFASRVNAPTLLSHLSLAHFCSSFSVGNPRRLILALLRIVTGVPSMIFWWWWLIECWLLGYGAILIRYKDSYFEIPSSILP